MDDSKPLLSARDIHGGYNGDDVLNGTSMDVLSGEAIAIIGPNGAGKSTFLRALFGMVNVRAGELIVSGQRIEKLSSIERLKLGMAFCPQGRCNFPAMSVKENLEMGGFLLPASRVPHAMERVLALFPKLKERLGQRAGTMSGGEQQQLEMAMSLMVQPEILLIDEPSLGLDPKNVEIIFHQLAVLQENQVTIIMVEQNAVKALQTTDRAYVLEQGKTRMTGPSAAILVDPEVRELYLGGTTQGARS